MLIRYLLLRAPMLLANVILATQIPYVMALMFCFLVVPIEAAILYAMERPVVGFGRSSALLPSQRYACARKNAPL